MAKTLRSEFTKRDWDDLQAAKRILHDLLPKFDKAEACGVDCTGYREICEEMRKRFAAIESNYLAERPK